MTSKEGCKTEQVEDAHWETVVGNIETAEPSKLWAGRGSTAVVAKDLGTVVGTKLEADDNSTTLGSDGLAEFGGALFEAAVGTSLFGETQWREAVRALDRQLGARFGTTVVTENATKQD